MDVRVKSLETLRALIESDDLVGVKLFKMKILSNLIAHIIPSNVTPGVPPAKDSFRDLTYREVTRRVEALKNNKYRE